MDCLGSPSQTDGKGNVDCTQWGLHNVDCWALLLMQEGLQRTSSIAGKLRPRIAWPSQLVRCHQHHHHSLDYIKQKQHAYHIPAVNIEDNL